MTLFLRRVSAGSCLRNPWTIVHTVWAYIMRIINSLRPRPNRRHFADAIFKCIFLNGNVSVAIKISPKFVSKCPISNIPALVHIMAWRRPGDKPISEPMMVSLPRHICVTRPQWVKVLAYWKSLPCSRFSWAKHCLTPLWPRDAKKGSITDLLQCWFRKFFVACLQQAITWISAELLQIGPPGTNVCRLQNVGHLLPISVPSGTNFLEIQIKTIIFAHANAICKGRLRKNTRPFPSGVDVLMRCILQTYP